MNKKELINDMKQYCGAGFISKTQLASYMGYKSSNSVTPYLHGLLSIDRRYFIPEVADRLLLHKKGAKDGI